ncbi:MAG: hypothetical protein WCC64_08510 [Aliidongia sp.]
MAGRQPKQAQLTELLAALDRSVRDVAARATQTQSGIGHHSFAPYHAYRASVDEYYALVSVIENIVRADGSAQADRVRAMLLDRERKLLTLMIRAALEFFFALSAIPNLPFGIRECFAQELQSMSAAHERLQAPEHKDKLPQELGQDLEIAEEILAEVMRKAPSLMSFDAA